MTEEMTEEMTENNDRRNDSINDFYGSPAAIRDGRFSEAPSLLLWLPSCILPRRPILGDSFATCMAWSEFLSEAFPRNPILGTQTFLKTRNPILGTQTFLEPRNPILGTQTFSKLAEPDFRYTNFF